MSGTAKAQKSSLHCSDTVLRTNRAGPGQTAQFAIFLGSHPGPLWSVLRSPRKRHVRSCDSIDVCEAFHVCGYDLK